mmetsp:Transcript_1264/g.1762  ORF Transcript_1264/g.1762 Transcript_1264/m.1762 type:complete len:96 (+) Transcript_1264:397-684(+)
MKKLAMPIVIPRMSLLISLFISDVIKWQPRDGAVMEISCWNQRILIVSEDDGDDSRHDDVEDGEGFFDLVAVAVTNVKEIIERGKNDKKTKRKQG